MGRTDLHRSVADDTKIDSVSRSRAGNLFVEAHWTNPVGPLTTEGTGYLSVYSNGRRRSVAAGQ